MKLTKLELKQLIREEIKVVLKTRTRPSTPGFGWGDIEEEYFEVHDESGDLKGRVEYDISTKRWIAFDTEGSKVCYQPEKGKPWGMWKSKKEAIQTVLHGEKCEEFFKKVFLQ